MAQSLSIRMGYYLKASAEARDSRHGLPTHLSHGFKLVLKKYPQQTIEVHNFRLNFILGYFKPRFVAIEMARNCAKIESCYALQWVERAAGSVGGLCVAALEGCVTYNSLLYYRSCLASFPLKRPFT